MLAAVGASPPLAGAEVVDRYPVAIQDATQQIAGPVLDGDGVLFWGRAVDAAPGEGGRTDEAGLGQVRNESPGWLVRAAAPGAAPSTLAHRPFPVSGYRQGLRLAAGGGRVALSAIAFVYDKYEGTVEVGGTTQVGFVGGPLSAFGCAGPLIAVDATRLVRFGCGEYGNSVDVQEPGANHKISTNGALQVAAGGGIVAVATPGRPAEPPRVLAIDPPTGAARVLRDDGLRAPALVVGDDGTVIASRQRPDGTLVAGLDALHPDGTRTELPSVDPLRLVGSRLLGRRGPTLSLVDTRTGAETEVLSAPGLTAADMGPSTIAWARYECNEIVIERAALDGRAIPTPADITCPTADVLPPVSQRITAGGATLVRVRCPAGCQGTVDLYGTLGVYGRRNVNLQARPGAQRVRVQLGAEGRRKVRSTGRATMTARLAVTAESRPVRRASRRFELRRQPR